MTTDLSSIFASDGKSLMIAVDHTAYRQAPVSGLHDVRGVCARLRDTGCVEAFIAGLGSIKHYRDAFAGTHTIASLDNSGAFADLALQRAIQLGASAFKSYLFPFSGDDSIQRAYRAATEAERMGVPFIAEPFPWAIQALDKHTVETITAAARISFETGADVIKSKYTGDADSMKKLVEYCAPVPVVILGGSGKSTTEEFLTSIHDAINKAGCAGVAIGTKIFTAESPEKMTRAIHAIVHDDATVDQALKLL